MGQAQQKIDQGPPADDSPGQQASSQAAPIRRGSKLLAEFDKAGSASQETLSPDCSVHSCSITKTAGKAPKGHTDTPCKPGVAAPVRQLLYTPAASKAGAPLDNLLAACLTPEAARAVREGPQETSPYAVQAGRSPPAKLKQQQAAGLAGEDPSSKERAEQLLHAIEAVGDWRLLCLLGMGGMSNVYLAQHSRQPGRSCAVKLTKDFVLDSSQPESDPCAAAVLLEWRTYQQIGRSSGAKRKLGSGQEAAAAAVKSGKAGKPGGAQPAPQPGKGALPAAYGYGFVEAPHTRRRHGWLALQLLGWNLHAVSTDTKQPLTWARFYLLATGMLGAVEALHARRLVHRDIKPGNFCLGGSGEETTVYLVDFGFVQALPEKGQGATGEKFCGTPDFASSAALRGARCGPGDDCESLGYSILQLWNGGSVPWDITRITPKPARAANALQAAGLTSSCAEESSGDSDLSWTPERLSAMADTRAAIWDNMEREGEIPQFLLSWQLYLTRLAYWELPDYGLLRKLLAGSHRAWEDFHPGASDASDRVPGKATLRTPLLAPEE